MVLGRLWGLNPPFMVFLALFQEKAVLVTFLFFRGFILLALLFDEGPCGAPWGLEFCCVIFLAFMLDKARLYVP